MPAAADDPVVVDDGSLTGIALRDLYARALTLRVRWRPSYRLAVNRLCGFAGPTDVKTSRPRIKDAASFRPTVSFPLSTIRLGAPRRRGVKRLSRAKKRPSFAEDSIPHRQALKRVDTYATIARSFCRTVHAQRMLTKRKLARPTATVNAGKKAKMLEAALLLTLRDVLKEAILSPRNFERLDKLRDIWGALGFGALSRDGIKQRLYRAQHLIRSRPS